MFPNRFHAGNQNEQPKRCSTRTQLVGKASLQKAQKEQEMETKWKRKKNVPSFCCEKCDYVTTRKSNFDRHLLSLKHSERAKRANERFLCNTCNKLYMNRSGLWKHQSKCKNLKKEDGEAMDVIKELLKTNAEMSKTNQKLIETINGIVPQIGNNTINQNKITNNQKISINVFLNEKCKNAMNLTDFIDNIQVTFNDLADAVECGGVESISDILIKRLTNMKPTDRPIHCSDKKRLQFYIKDENKWGKDSENIKIDDSIHEINNKQMKKLHEWVLRHPNWDKNITERDEYIRMVNKIAWPAEESKKNKEKIKRNLSQAIEIKDAMK